MCAPRGDAPPKSSRRTVAPTTQTAVPARTSESVKERPASSFMFRTAKMRSSEPVTVVVQLALPAMAEALVVAEGATAAIAVTRRSSSSASSARKSGALDSWPGPIRWPGVTMSRLLPISAI